MTPFTCGRTIRAGVAIPSVVRIVLAAILTGLVAGAFAIVFRLALATGLRALTGTGDVLIAFQSLSPAMRLAMPTTGAALAGLIGALAVRGKGHGMADVMEAVALGRGGMSLPMVLAKSVASYAALVTGGSLGREGSILQFGAAIGDAIGARAGLMARERRALLAAGTAAGFAAAYNTPIAAIVFVIEVITGVVDLEVLLPVILATTTSTALTRWAIGGVPLYGQRSFALETGGELLAHALVGILAGLAGPVFMRMLFATESRVRASGVPRAVATAAGGLVVGALALRWPEVTGNGFEAIQQTLDGKLVGGVLLALLAAKAVATVASVGTGSPGGVFTPSMFLGAALGGTVAWLVPQAFSAAGPSGGYALVGMAAMLAATTHAPLMAATLAFELSGDYAIVLPLLVATSVAAFLSRSIHPESVYTEELRRRGIPWHGSLAQRLAKAVRARDILERDPATVLADAPVGDALRLLDEGARAVYVIGAPMRVIGNDTARALWAARARGELVAATAAEAAKIVDAAAPDDDLLALSEKLWRQDQGQIPVVDRLTHALLGVVTRRGVLGAIDREVLDRDALLTRIVRHEGTDASAEFLELPAKWHAQTIAAPATLVGRAVDHAALRDELGVVVIGMRPRGRGAIVDVAGHTLDANDQLLVVGPISAIEALQGKLDR